MILSETRYNEQDYERLVLELIQCANIDEELQFSTQSILNFNPNFYLLMFKTVEQYKQAPTFKNNDKNLAALINFEKKLFEYTNFLPADLPEAILKDRRFRDLYLSNHNTIHFKKDDWQDFKDIIEEKVDSIPKRYAIPFLEWCVNMLQMNWKKHIKICDKSGNCKWDTGYDKRIQFISKLIEQTTPIQAESETIGEETQTPTKSIIKIQWLGSQKELAELFVELKKKGWIEKFENETIQNCFTESNSVPQYLKPGTNTKTGEHTFENLYTGYSPQFYGIKENPKRHK